MTPSKRKKIRADQLTVDEHFRAVGASHRKRIANDLDLPSIGVLHVSERRNGDLVILDGQHRHGALMQNGLGNHMVECIVYTGLTLEGEATLFRRLNSTKKATPIDDFFAGLQEGDEECIDIDRIVGEHGYRVWGQTGLGNVTGVSTLRTIYSTNGDGRAPGELLTTTLDVIQKAWGVAPGATDGQVIQGVASFIDKHGADIDRDALVNKMSKFPGAAPGLLAHARGLRDLKRGSTIPQCIAEVLLISYNSGRKHRIAA
jgi:hypothetical protein